MIEDFFKKIKSPMGIAVTCVVVLLIALTITISVFSANMRNSSVIYNNVWVNDVCLQGLEPQQAMDTLKERYVNFADDNKVTLKYKDIEKEVLLQLINAHIDYTVTVQNAYDVGRLGNYFENLSKYIALKYKKTTLPLEVSMNNYVFKDKIVEFTDEVEGKYKIFSIDENKKTLTIDKSELEYVVDSDMTYHMALGTIKNGMFRAIGPEFMMLGTPAQQAQMIHERLCTEPVDASVTNENGDLEYIKEKVGINFDVNLLSQALAGADEVVTVPIETTTPKVTVEYLKTVVFKDILAEFTTRYDSKVVGRTTNVRVAANNINNTIILPKHNFSFNGVVGERSYSTGFADGRVFWSGQIIEGVGGGICQVSSTLYSVALYADLEIVERHNHSFAINYAPLGQDATVAYGALDFVFKNNTLYPIKVVTSVGGGQLNIKIYGTNTDPDKQIEIWNNTIASNPFNTVTKVNPNPNAVRNVTEQAGITGYTIDTYKIYKRNGVEEKRVLLHRSVYSPLEKVVLTPSKQTSDPVVTHPPVATPPAIAPPTPEENEGESWAD